MEFIFEPLIQFLGELVLQLFLRVVVRLLIGGLINGLFNALPMKVRPIVSMLGWALLGGLAGHLSLLFLPASLIAYPLLRQINLVVTPTLVGLVMLLAGRRQTKFGRTVLILDQFAYANTFTFFAVLVRFIWAG